MDLLVQEDKMTNIEFVEKVKSILEKPTVFAYGTYGEVVSDKLIAYVYITQRNKYHSDDNILRLKEHYGEYAYECTGIIVEPLGLANPPSANEMYFNSKEKYLIENMPMIPGICVYFLGHVGVYIGDGKVIESTYSPKFGFGVVETNLYDRPWTTAFKLSYINYL